MPKKDIKETVFYRILSELDKHDEISNTEISQNTGVPLPTVRRILGELLQLGRIEKKFVYTVKQNAK